MTTIEQSDSKKAIAEYNNLKFALEQEEDNILAGMTVTYSSLGYRGGYIDTTYSNTSTLCGILIPLGILIVVAIAYFICSANNMDLPGYDSAPQDFSQSERGEATEMRTLWLLSSIYYYNIIYVIITLVLSNFVSSFSEIISIFSVSIFGSIFLLLDLFGINCLGIL